MVASFRADPAISNRPGTAVICVVCCKRMFPAFNPFFFIIDAKAVPNITGAHIMLGRSKISDTVCVTCKTRENWFFRLFIFIDSSIASTIIFITPAASLNRYSWSTDITRVCESSSLAKRGKHGNKKSLKLTKPGQFKVKWQQKRTLESKGKTRLTYNCAHLRLNNKKNKNELF